MNEPERNVDFFTIKSQHAHDWATIKGTKYFMGMDCVTIHRPILTKLKTERYDPQTPGYGFTVGKDYDIYVEEFVDEKFWYLVYNDNNEPTIVRADDFYLHASFDKPVFEDDKKLHPIAMCDVRKEYKKLVGKYPLLCWEPTKEDLARWKRLADIGSLTNIDAPCYYY